MVSVTIFYPNPHFSLTCSPTGILVFAPSESLDFDATVASLKVNGEEHEVLTAEEVNSKYSEQLQLPADYKCVFEKDGGVLLANNAVAAYQVSLNVI